MSKPELIMTVGLPRSGKSTWARTQGMPIVSPDAIRFAMHGQPFIAEAEPYVWAVAHTMVAALFGAGHTHVILDATNITKARRDAWRSPNWTRAFQIFPTSAEVCKARATGDGIDGLLTVIDRMAAQYEPTQPDEY